jgi:hypothetical protein
MLEMLVAMAIALTVLLVVYQFVDWSRRTFVRQSDQANAQAAGRAAMELMASEIRTAGYNPMGVRFLALPSGSAAAIRVVADHDGDGVVGTAGELNENVTYQFVGPDSEGLYRLRRGVDLNGDGDFLDTDESVDVVATHVVPVDIDLDSIDEPFIVYNSGSAPSATRVTLTYGVRSVRKDVPVAEYDVATFQSAVSLRNRFLQ